MSASRSRRQVFLGLPRFLFPCGFQVRARLVVLQPGFLSVCPIHPHCLRRISCSTGICLVCCHSSWLLIFSGHLTFEIILRHPLMNVCSRFIVERVVLQVSAPYSRTGLTVVLNSLSFVFFVSFEAFHTFFRYLKAAPAFPIRTLTSASVPPFLSTILPRYVKLSTSSKATSSSKMGAVLVGFIFSILLFPQWMLSPSLLEFSATMLVFSCICC